MGHRIFKITTNMSKCFFSQKVHLLDQSKRARLFSKSKYEHKKQRAIVFGNEQASNACAFTWFFSISSTSKQGGKSEALEGKSLRHLYSKRPPILWAENLANKARKMKGINGHLMALHIQVALTQSPLVTRYIHMTKRNIKATQKN